MRRRPPRTTLTDTLFTYTTLFLSLRIGVGSAEIDNTTLGGLAAEIDLETGVCRAATSRFSIRTTVAHPDSGCRIEGLALPYWDLVKASAVKAHRFLPFARSLGWDIAFGIAGPIKIGRAACREKVCKYM